MTIDVNRISCFTCAKWCGNRRYQLALCTDQHMGTNGNDRCWYWVKRRNAKFTVHHCCFCHRTDKDVRIANTGTPMHIRCLHDAALGGLETTLFKKG